MPLPQLLKIPLELHYEIISHIDLDDHPSAISVCPLWKKILSSGASQQRRQNSYTRTSCVGKWFIVNSILRSGKLKIKMSSKPGVKGVDVRFFWKFDEGDNDYFEITDCELLDEAAVAWPVGHNFYQAELVALYGAIEELQINNHYLHKMLLYQRKYFDKKNIIKVKDIAVDCFCAAVNPLKMPPIELVNMECLIQIIDVRLNSPLNCLVIHERGGVGKVCCS